MISGSLKSITFKLFIYNLYAFNIQCNPDIKELSRPEKTYLISGFGLFYIH